MPINSVFSWFIKKRMHQMELFKQYPFDVQEEVRQKLIDQAALTQFGKDHAFEKIHSAKSFQSNIPVRNYEAFFPYIDQAVQGEENILWPGKTVHFAKSSGTSNGRSKFIPITDVNLEDCHYKGGKDLLALYYHLRPNADLYSGKTLVVGGSTKLNLDEETIIGDLSGIIVTNLPFWVEMKRVPNREISLMENWEDKLEAMAISTMNEDVRVLSGVPSWTALLLQRILELKNAEHMHEVWPNLQLYLHGGVSFAPYVKQFEQLLPRGTTDFIETYNASEGFFGIQDQLNAKDMLLMLDYGIYYEFIPMEELGKETPQALSLKQVELGVVYALVISTNSGLWRYLIGDTVVFTSLNPFRIQIVGRTKQFINIAGEELMISNADQALKTVSAHLNIHVKDYTVAPVFPNGNGAAKHEWIIELEEPLTDEHRFAMLLDEELRALNSDYDAKRKTDKNLAFPIIHIGRKNLFYDWLKRRNKLGGQNKVPRMMQTRELIDELLALNNHA